MRYHPAICLKGTGKPRETSTSIRIADIPNRVCPEYKPEALPLDSACLVWTERRREKREDGKEKGG
jgi:hypothetical protein